MQKRVPALPALFFALFLFLPNENIQAIEIDLHCARSISA